MSYNILIKGGTVVDGQNNPPFKADVRVANGKIVKVAPDLRREGVERVVDATGCYVTPGFIETHNHFDAPMWWMPNMFPLPGYGVTTSINGNCGFGAAPVHDSQEAKDAMIEIFSFFEDIPIAPFKTQLPWDWKTWKDYRESMQRHLKVPVNFEFFCGHQSLRFAAMGIDATKRAATDEEIKLMQNMLREALDAGAIGFSSNTMDYDAKGNPVPSLLAEDKEFSALFDVMDEYPDKTVEIIISTFQRFTGVEDMQRLEPLLKHRKFRTQWLGIPTLTYQLSRGVRPLIDEHERYKREGLPLYTGFSHIGPATLVNFNSPLTFAQSNNLVWAELAKETNVPRKLEMLQDEQWRARARDSWDQQYPQSMFRRPEAITMTDSQYRVGPYGSEVTFRDVIDARGNIHPSDALAEWLLDNGLGSTLGFEMHKESVQQIVDLFRDENAVGNISDSGAHAQMLCGIGNHIDFITAFARDANLLQLEEAIYNLTGKLANFFGLRDRGHIAEGKTADIAVWNIDEIERRPMIKEYDVPDGSGGRAYRYTRDAAPMRLTLVHGEPVFDGGSFTGAYPGQIAGYETHEAFAQAAE